MQFFNYKTFDLITCTLKKIQITSTCIQQTNKKTILCINISEVFIFFYMEGINLIEFQL